MSDEHTTVVIDKVLGPKEGETNGKPWTKWTVKDGNGAFYSTFDGGKLGPNPLDWAGKRAEIVWKASGNEGQFKDLLSIKQIEESPIAAVAEDGTANWDLIGLRKTRCLLWAHYLGSVGQALPFASLAGLDGAALDGIYKAGVRLVRSAERDIYHREPASDTEDVPFMFLDVYGLEPGVHRDPWRPR